MAKKNSEVKYKVRSRTNILTSWALLSSWVAEICGSCSCNLDRNTTLGRANVNVGGIVLLLSGVLTAAANVKGVCLTDNGTVVTSPVVDINLTSDNVTVGVKPVKSPSADSVL